MAPVSKPILSAFGARLCSSSAKAASAGLSLRHVQPDILFHCDLPSIRLVAAPAVGQSELWGATAAITSSFAKLTPDRRPILHADSQVRRAVAPPDHIAVRREAVQRCQPEQKGDSSDLPVEDQTWVRPPSTTSSVPVT
jgi:hypothetical protein